ncbi:MAG: hypothetical protein PHT57_07345 [Rhodoferax sp.]|jgi:hypothetical protein|nr:hypothetical protein [Rhodoferax sp.]
MNNTQAAADRLAHSRERLRQALSQGANAAGGTHVKLIAKTAYGLAATVARNRPLAAVVGTALLGALLVRTKAWRWLSMSALFAAFTPQLVKALVHQEKS